MKNAKILIIAAIVISLATRLIGLKVAPPHLSNDEISIAYDAYSISKTLRDEHNHYLPIAFQSHNTYKAPLTIYLSVLPTIILGNNEYSARLPSAILGILTIPLIGFLVYEMSKNYNLSFITSFLLAITPWHIYTSRMALESNVALFFVIAGLYLAFYGKNHNKKAATILSFVSFALSMYGYHTEWVLTPLILVAFYFIYRKYLMKNKNIFLGLLLFLFLITPLFVNYLHNIGTNARANTEMITANAVIQKQLGNPDNNPFKIFQIIVSSVLGSYSSYTNFGYLFFNGLRLIPSPDPFQIGLFLAPFLPCFLVGIFVVKKYFKENSLFLYLWIVLSPIVPAMTEGGFNAVRNLTSVAPYTILIGAGCFELFYYFQKKKIILYIWLILAVTSLFYFLILYYYHFPKENGENFQYGYKQIALYIKDNYPKYNKIVVDPKFGEGNIYDGVPHLYISYFTSLDPQKLLDRSNVNGLDFDKYEIRVIQWDYEKIQPDTLYIVPYANRPSGTSSKTIELLTEIELPNTKKAFALYEMSPSQQ